MNPDKHRRRLREILAGDICVTANSLFDPMSARIATELGIEVGLMGGSVASYAVLGAPDIVLLTMTELVEQARRVCRAGDLGVIVDADHGYGNALNVMRTVEELAAAGVAGITIEDTLLPRPFGATGAAQLVSLEEGVGKIKAALAARRDSGVAIFGRTSAAAITGVDDAIRRLIAYQECGVNALFLPGLKTRAELDRIAAAVKLPIILGAPDEQLHDRAYLAARGVRVVMTGHRPFVAAVEAMYEAIRAAHEGTPSSAAKKPASGALMATLARSALYERLAKEFLGAP
jgi:oxaloacetate decarboxylase